MDKTISYIEKLEKAPEIQRAWRAPQDGDFVWHPNEGVEHMGTWEFPEKFDIVSLANHDEEWWYHWLWLPRQDQLQDMVKYKSVTHSDDVYIKIEKFYQYVNEIMSGKIDSMEQLWLGFVMKQKYHKVWNGKDWMKG